MYIHLPIFKSSVSFVENYRKDINMHLRDFDQLFIKMTASTK